MGDSGEVGNEGSVVESVGDAVYSIDNDADVVSAGAVVSCGVTVLVVVQPGRDDDEGQLGVVSVIIFIKVYINDIAAKDFEMCYSCCD